MKHTLKFVALALAIALAGCSAVRLPGGLSIPTSSNPLADALKQCAMFTELLTPGVNLATVAQLARNATQDNVLGNTPQGAMRNCAGLLDTIAN